MEKIMADIGSVVVIVCILLAFLGVFASLLKLADSIQRVEHATTPQELASACSFWASSSISNIPAKCLSVLITK